MKIGIGDLMIGLIIKDLRLSIKIKIFVIAYALVVSYIGISLPKHPVANIIYILFIVMGVFALTIYTNGMEDRYSTQIVLNSLPVNRDSIVAAKYITLVAYIAISWIAVFAFTNILEAAGLGSGNTAGIWDFIIAACICIIFYSVYYPFYFRLGEGIRTFNQVLWIMVFILPTAIARLGKSVESKGMLVDIYNRLSTLNLYNIALIVSVSLLVVFYISIQISKKLYRMREF